MIIHVLLYGLTFCGMHTAPVTWPLGHFWVGVSEKDKATCPGCKAVGNANKEKADY